MAGDAHRARPTMTAKNSRTQDDFRRHRKMLAVLAQFRVLFRSIRQHYQRVERRSGVTGAQLWAVVHVAGHPGAKVGELAKALAVHPSTASNLVRRLESL